MKPTKIGLITDTHFSVKRTIYPQVIDFFSDVSLILHAGDIGDKKEFSKLKRIAPVIAVQGNKKQDKLNFKLKQSQTIRLKGLTIFLTHGLGNPIINYLEYFLGKILQLKTLSTKLVLLRLKTQSRNANLVIFGHLHRVCVKKTNNQIFINPGAAYNTSNRIGSIAKITIKGNNLYQLQFRYLIP